MRLMSKIFYLSKEGFISIFSHGFMSFASITIIIACLIIMGSASLLSMNFSAIIQSAENENVILAFLDENLPFEEAEELKDIIERLPNVKEAVFVTNEVAMEEYADRFEPELFEDIDPTVFRHRYVVSMKDITQMENTVGKLMQIRGIVKVNASLAIAKGFITARNIVSAVSMVLGVILVVVSVFIMANTIKLTTFSRREEIAIMKMVGATNGFIRWPFVVEGVVLGLIGATFAFLIQWGVYTLLTDRIVTSIAGNSWNIVSFDAVRYQILFAFSGIGLFVGSFGGVVAIRNYLKV